jgi:hypothetical protein
MTTEGTVGHRKFASTAAGSGDFWHLAVLWQLVVAQQHPAAKRP